MSKKIKLIWDFRGPVASETARHHAEHLKEYIAKETLDFNIIGYKELSNAHSMAFMVVEENQMVQVRDALKPHRGELYDVGTT